MGINNSLLKSVQTLIDKAINVAPFDKTRQAQIVTNNDDGTYIIRLDGVLYNNVSSYPKSTSITEGSVVKIVTPSNQSSQMYIVSPKGGGGDHLEITQEDYDDLPIDKKQGDTVFFVTESDSEYLIMSDSVPIGAIQSYGGNVAPSGWLICDGRAISRIEYSELFYAIGTTYGSGDGSTTFNIPDLKGRTLVGVGNSGATGATNHTLGQKDGEETHALQVSEMPSHKHRLAHRSVFVTTGTSGSWFLDPGTAELWSDSPSIEATGGNGAHNNMQPYTVVNYIIKAKQPPTENVIKGLDPQEVLIDAFYPVGTEYSTMNSVFDPNVTWGGTWTKATISDDEIIEQGISGIWTYRKWKSGIAECWTTIRQQESAGSPSGQEGQVFWRPSGEVSFPSGLFNATPSAWVWTGNGGSYLVWASLRVLDSTKVSWYYVYDVNVSMSPFWQINAKGTWKAYIAPSLKYVWHRTA